MYTDELITQVRNLAQVPDTDEDITDEFILTQAYLGLLERFTQPIVMMRNGSWLHSYTWQTTAGVSRYRLPARSIVQGLEKLECAMGQGASNSNSSQWYLLNVQTNIQATSYEGLNYMGRPAAFTYIGDTVEIYPTPTQDWTLRVFYYLRPSQLITPTEYFLFADTPNAIGTSVVAMTQVDATTYDVEVQGDCFNALGGFRRFDLQFDNGNCEKLAVNVIGEYSGTPNHLLLTLTANQAALLTLASTDYTQGFDVLINLSDDSTCVIQLPQELSNALVSYVGAVVLAEKGDSEKAQVFSQKAELAIKNIVDIAMPRSKGQPSVFRTQNTYLRRRVGRFGWGGGWGAY